MSLAGLDSGSARIGLVIASGDSVPLTHIESLSVEVGRRVPLPKPIRRIRKLARPPKAPDAGQLWLCPDGLLRIVKEIRDDSVAFGEAYDDASLSGHAASLAVQVAPDDGLVVPLVDMATHANGSVLSTIDAAAWAHAAEIAGKITCRAVMSVQTDRRILTIEDKHQLIDDTVTFLLEHGATELVAEKVEHVHCGSNPGDSVGKALGKARAQAEALIKTEVIREGICQGARSMGIKIVEVIAATWRAKVARSQGGGRLRVKSDRAQEETIKAGFANFPTDYDEHVVDAAGLVLWRVMPEPEKREAHARSQASKTARVYSPGATPQQKRIETREANRAAALASACPDCELPMRAGHRCPSRCDKCGELWRRHGVDPNNPASLPKKRCWTTISVVA